MTLQDELRRLGVEGEALPTMEYVDVRMEDSEVVTVNLKHDRIEVLVFDPDDPSDTIAEFEFERDEPSEEAAARAEIEAERKLDEKRERHFDRNGHF